MTRIHAYLAHRGVASRRKIEEMIREGKILVDGVPAVIGQQVTGQETFTIDGEVLEKSPAEVVTYLVYKPVGVISTTDDELHRQNIVQYLAGIVPKTEQLPRLYPVGRLDKDSEGLMMLTNDGELAQRMTHPSYETIKTYRITVSGQPTELALAHLRRGVLLKEGMTAPADVEVIESTPVHTILDISIHEGRYHQVKRMMLRVGYEVQKLVRTRLGDYTLEQLNGVKYLKV